MNLVYLGPLSSFMARNLILGFRGLGYRVTALNTGGDTPRKQKIRDEFPDVPIFDLSAAGPPRLGFRDRIKHATLRALAATGLSRNVALARTLDRTARRLPFFQKKPYELNDRAKSLIRGVLASARAEVVYSFWGHLNLPEARFIQQELGTPVVQEITVYPFAFSEPRHADPDDRRVIESFSELDGRIHASQRARDYLFRHFHTVRGRDLIWWHHFSEDYFFRRRLPLLSARDRRPHVIFLGRTDFGNSPFDDVRPQLRAITRSGIHVHIGETRCRPPGTPFLHMFPPVAPEGGELATFMTAFDACIVLYNVDREYDRFRGGMPARFQFALAAGIPVVLPASRFAACEEVVTSLGVGFAYNDVAELKQKLSDQALMGELRGRAEVIAPNLTFEANSRDLDLFIRQVGLCRSRSTGPPPEDPPGRAGLACGRGPVL